MKRLIESLMVAMMVGITILAVIAMFPFALVAALCRDCTTRYMKEF